MVQHPTICKKDFQSASTKRKLTGIEMLNTKGNILKKINVSFIVHICLDDYSFSLDTF